jgi:hypothetical protein
MNLLSDGGRVHDVEIAAGSEPCSVSSMTASIMHRTVVHLPEGASHVTIRARGVMAVEFQRR